MAKSPSAFSIYSLVMGFIKHASTAHHDGIEAIMETSQRHIRKFGETVIVIDEEPTQLGNCIKANTSRCLYVVISRRRTDAIKNWGAASPKSGVARNRLRLYSIDSSRMRP